MKYEITKELKDIITKMLLSSDLASREVQQICAEISKLPEIKSAEAKTAE